MIPLTKKISGQLLCFLLIALSSTVVTAQKFSIGVQAAGSINNSYGQGTDTYLSTTIYGCSFGAFGTFQLFEKFKIRAEALLSSRGFNSQYSSTGASTPSLYGGYIPTLGSNSATSSAGSDGNSATQKQQTIYFDVPVGLDYQVIPHVNLQAGAMFSFFVKEYYNSLSNSSTVDQPQPADTQYYQTIQFYVYGGAYYQFNFGLQAGARANVGLSQTFIPVSTGTGNQVYPYNLQLFVSYPILKF